MKLALIALSLLSATPALAREIVLTGNKARTVMENLAGAGFELKNIDTEWSSLREPISVTSGAFLCHYSAIHPDEWMLDAKCTEGKAGEPRGKELENSFALAQAIKPYASADAGLGNRWIWLDNAHCTLDYNKRAYRCVLTVDSND